MPVTPWPVMVRIGEMSLLIQKNNRAHVKEFDDWVENYPGGRYSGGRTTFITEDGTKYDLGGPGLVYVDTENENDPI